MALITKENAAHYRQLSLESRARKKRAQEQALAAVAALQNPNLIPREIRTVIESQLQMLTKLIAEEIASGVAGRVRIQDLLRAQLMLLQQVRFCQEEPEGPANGNGARPKPVMIRPLGSEQGPARPGARMASEPGNCGVEPTSNGVPPPIEESETPQLL